MAPHKNDAVKVLQTDNKSNPIINNRTVCLLATWLFPALNVCKLIGVGYEAERRR